MIHCGTCHTKTLKKNIQYREFEDIIKTINSYLIDRLAKSILLEILLKNVFFINNSVTEKLNVIFQNV